MSGRVVSVANLKGGVGKTTTAVMLADGLSMREAAEGGRPNRVLVIDADPQASLGFALVGSRRIRQAADAALSVNTMMNQALMHRKRVDVESFVIGNISRNYGSVAGKVVKGDVSLIPSSPAMIFSEQMLIRDMTKRKLTYDETLQRVFNFVRDDLLAHARKIYDWTIVDCAPGMNMLARTAICASDTTVVTTVPEPLSTFGFDVFLSTVWAEEFDLLPPPRRPLVLLTRVAESQKGHAIELDRIERAVRDTPLCRLFRTRVPEAALLDGQGFLKATPMTMKGRYKGSMFDVVTELAAELTEVVDAD